MHIPHSLRAFIGVVLSYSLVFLRLAESACPLKCSDGEYWENGLGLCRPCTEICVTEIETRLEKCVQEVTCKALWPKDEKSLLLCVIPAVVTAFLIGIGAGIGIKRCYDWRQTRGQTPSLSSSLPSNIGKPQYVSIPILVDPIPDPMVSEGTQTVTPLSTQKESSGVDIKCGPDEQMDRGVLPFQERVNNDGSGEYGGTQTRPEEHTVLLSDNSCARNAAIEPKCV